MPKLINIYALRPMTMTAVLLLLTLQLSIASGQPKPTATDSPKPSPSPTATPSTPDNGPAMPIPMLDVVARADELTVRLQAMTTQVNADQRLASVDTQLKATAPAIAQKQRELDDLIAITPTRSELAELEQEWLAEQVQYLELKETLAKHGSALEGDVTFLEAQEKQWAATSSAIPRNEVTTSVHERIANALNEIGGAQKVLRVAQANLLALQDEISQQNKVVTEALSKIAQLRARAQRSLLERDGPALWELFSGATASQSVGGILDGSYQRNALRTRAFLRSQSSLLWLSLAMFLVTLAGSVAVRKSGSRILKFEPSLKHSLSLFDNPVSLALLTSLTVILLFGPSVPQLIRGAGILLCLYPVLTLYVRRIAASFRPVVLSLMVFGLIRSVFEILNLSPTVRRVIVTVWQVAFVLFMGWLVQKAYRKAEVLDRKTQFVLGITWVLLALLTVAILANVFGYVSLSLILSGGSVLSAFAAIVLRTEFMVVNSLLTMLVMFGRGSSLSILNTYGNEVATWGRRLAAIILLYLWTYVSLTAFGVRRAVMDAASRIFYTPFKLGAAGITLWDIAVFVLVLVIGVFVAGITRVVLRDDILGRLNLKHGIPYAISTLSYYVMLLLVFVLALAAAGVELSKFTLLTGAFGVGVGFGLQNTINNFASGLILLFERPIRVGDFLEVGNVIGEVERIGMRSSSMRTIEGAEVIVPNSNLVTNQVTNWTLSKPRRRVVVRMMTRWDADPEMVLDVMLKVAESLPGIMTAPKPDAMFLGIERGFPRFELRFWVNQVRRHQKARSEAAIKLHAAFTEAGVNLDVRQLFLKKELEGLTDESATLAD